MDVDGKPKIMSVVFVPHTEGSQLAKMWREKLTEFENKHGYAISDGNS